MAKQLCMLSKVDKGREARKYFIECERQLLQQNKKKDLVLAIYGGGVGAVEAHKTLVEMEVEDSADFQKKRTDIQSELIMLITKGYVETYEDVKGYFDR